MANPKQQLIDAAGPLFAKQGYEATSVRAVTAHAGVNLAMVNYHFFSKQGLFLTVVRDCVDCLSVRSWNCGETTADDGWLPSSTHFRKHQILANILAWEIIKPSGLRDEIGDALNAFSSPHLVFSRLFAAIEELNTKSIS